MKRDTEFVILLGFLIWLLAVAFGRQGILTIVTVVVNSIIFVIAILKTGNTENLLRGCVHIVFFFSIFTLILLNGFQKKDSCRNHFNVVCSGNNDYWYF